MVGGLKYLGGFYSAQGKQNACKSFSQESVRCNDGQLVHIYLSEPVMERRLGDLYTALEVKIV